MIATDLDGTLLAGKSNLPEGNIIALKRAMQAGVQVVIASGRMIEATAQACLERHPGQCAGLLGTRQTLQGMLYTEALQAIGVESLIPDEEGIAVLMDVIFGLKAGRLPPRADFVRVLDDLRARGADYFVLGCTELPDAVAMYGVEDEFIDSNLEIALAAIRFCGYETLPPAPHGAATPIRFD